MHTKYGVTYLTPCGTPNDTGPHSFFGEHTCSHTGCHVLGKIFRTLTQNHKCTLLIPSKHMIIQNDKHKSNMETTIRRSHRMKYSWFTRTSSRSGRVSSKTPAKLTPIHFQKKKLTIISILINTLSYSEHPNCCCIIDSVPCAESLIRLKTHHKVFPLVWWEFFYSNIVCNNTPGLTPPQAYSVPMTSSSNQNLQCSHTSRMPLDFTNMQKHQFNNILKVASLLGLDNGECIHSRLQKLPINPYGECDMDLSTTCGNTRWKCKHSAKKLPINMPVKFQAIKTCLL